MTTPQSETYYVFENVTDYLKCLHLNNFTEHDIPYTLSSELSAAANRSNQSHRITCMHVEEFIQDMNLSCDDATQNDRRFVGVGNREGMNVMGIIIFTIAFGVTLGRLGPEGRGIVRAVGVLNSGIMKLVSLVMW